MRQVYSITVKPRSLAGTCWMNSSYSSGSGFCLGLHRPVPAPVFPLAELDRVFILASCRTLEVRTNVRQLAGESGRQDQLAFDDLQVLEERLEPGQLAGIGFRVRAEILRADCSDRFQHVELAALAELAEHAERLLLPGRQGVGILADPGQDSRHRVGVKKAVVVLVRIPGAAAGQPGEVVGKRSAAIFPSPVIRLEVPSSSKIISTTGVSLPESAETRTRPSLGKIRSVVLLLKMNRARTTIGAMIRCPLWVLDEDEAEDHPGEERPEAQ